MCKIHRFSSFLLVACHRFGLLLFKTASQSQRFSERPADKTNENYVKIDSNNKKFNYSRKKKNIRLVKANNPWNFLMVFNFQVFLLKWKFGLWAADYFSFEKIKSFNWIGHFSFQLYPQLLFFSDSSCQTNAETNCKYWLTNNAMNS